MQLPEKVVIIREKLISDEITWSEALEQLKSIAKKKPWDYKEWREERQEIIQNCCSSCGSDSGIMVLQHLHHPPKINSIFNFILNGYIDEHQDRFDKHVDEYIKKEEKAITSEIGDREVCPECESTNVVYRKTFGNWSCKHKKKKNGKYYWKCGAVFDKPNMRKLPTIRQRSALSQINYYAKRDAWSKMWEEVTELYGKSVVLKSIEDKERYFSLIDTTTFCKKCAYLMDRKGLIFCDERQDYARIKRIEGCCIYYSWGFLEEDKKKTIKMNKAIVGH